MPRALRLCPCGCLEAVAAGARCEASIRSRAQLRGSAAQRGYDSRWERTARRHLRRHPLCTRCGAIARHVHHKDGLGPLGPRGYDPANWESLCHRCHSQVTAMEQPGGWNNRL